MKHKKGIGDILIDVMVYSILSVVALMTLLPFMNVLAKSVSAEWAVISGKVGILPVDFQLDTMKYVITTPEFIKAFMTSFGLTIFGTIGALLMTAITAYPLSKRRLPGIKAILILYVFTMLFNGGLIPNYLLIKRLNLTNNLLSLVLPALISTYNMLIIKNYYESLPESLEESAKLDGASVFTILFRIILPLSTPVLATIGLFYAVFFWNDYFNAMIYITKPALKPLQLYLRDIVMDADTASAGMNRSLDDYMNISPEGVRSATIIASTLPILMVYPFLQKYFIKGILIGSVKG